MNDGNVSAVFVYGTLQRGEEREPCWPHAPLAIETAEILAALYDLGDYPAIINGTDRVVGELWRFHPQEIAATLHVLDEIEGYGQGGVDLYVRQVVECRTVTGTVKGYTYFLADEAEAQAGRRVFPSADGRCRWHRFR